MSNYSEYCLSLHRSRIVDNGLQYAIITDIMENTAEPGYSELWRQWKPRSITLTVAQTRQLGITKRAHVYDWLYELGIQPDRYICRKASSGRGHIEIRFGYSEDVSFIKMSGLIPD